MKGKRVCERILSIKFIFFKKKKERTRKSEITRFQWRNSSGPLQYSLVTVDLINELHGAEFFFEKPLVARYSRFSQHFMESEGSLPCSQQPSTIPYPQPYESNPQHPMLFF
jgi:hypothetical protein